MYESLFSLTNTGEVKAKAFHNCCQSSKTIAAHFFKIATQPTIKSANLTHPPHERYAGNGTTTLLHLEKRTTDFKEKKSLGFVGKDVELTVEFAEATTVEKIIVSTLGNTEAWVFLPTEVAIFSSDNGRDFKKIGTEQGFENTESTPFGLQYLTVNFSPKSSRFFKIVIKNQGLIPQWHVGKGTAAWLFVDEVLFF